MTHEQHLQELFDSVAVEFQGQVTSKGHQIFCITREGFELVADQLMKKGYYYGCQQMTSAAMDQIDKTINPAHE